jgi:hypothetical protein
MLRGCALFEPCYTHADLLIKTATAVEPDGAGRQEGFGWTTRPG